MNIVTKSYGIILINNNNILIINRKNSIYYIEFIMGKYRFGDTKYLELMFKRITTDEKLKILNNKFIDLWTELWGDINQDKYIYYYKVGLKKFEILKKNDLLLNRLCNIKTYEETEWEFPKGRKEKNEVNINCAIRELEEESHIKKDEYDIINNISPIIEEYVSTNNIKYRICYYVGIYKTDKLIDKVINNNEIKQTKWININECVNYIRTYNRSKLCIIDILKSIIDRYQKDYYIINTIYE